MEQLCTFLGGVLINPCVTSKQRGGLWWRWIREAPGKIVTVLLKSLCRITAHIHSLFKLYWIHFYGLEFILLERELQCWPACPWGSHHSAHSGAGWNTTHRGFCTNQWVLEGRTGSAQVHSQSHWALLGMTSFMKTSFTSSLFFGFFWRFFFPSRLMTVLHFDNLGWVFSRRISALSHIILIIFFRKMMTRKSQEFLGIKQGEKMFVFWSW